MIHFCVNMDDLQEIESAFGMMKDKSRHVLRAALNQTAKDVVKKLPAEAAQEYYLKQTEARKTLDIRKATVKNLVAVVTSKGKTLELYGSQIAPKRYSPHNRPPAGHTGNVKKGNNPGALVYRPGAKDEYKAFIVKYKNNHISIARRVPGKYMAGKKKEALKNLRTSSIPNMLYHVVSGEEELFNKNRGEIEQLLQKNIQEQIKRFIK